jgi:hypothetical protein
MTHLRLATFAALFVLAAGGTAFAQQPPPGADNPAPLPTNNPEASANVKESEAYSQLLRTNPSFRKKREQIECGPIADPQLHQQCVNSFEAYASAPAPKRSQH